MSALDESDDFRSAAMAGRLAFLDAGTSNARAKIYNAPRPAFGASHSCTLLAIVPFAKPTGSISAGTLVVALGADVQILATGEAVWAEVVSGDDEVAFHADVSDLAGTAPLKLPTTQLYAGAFTRIASGVFG